VCGWVVGGIAAVVTVVSGSQVNIDFCNEKIRPEKVK